ncbi:serine/threonine-protein kinase [Nonomuraea sp. NPDC050394]|uniref:serine/threonine-protein kinase n=1 Tax=Nonomuraea sp. NPDC050394 TaxID=3364363 RepID=UPI0037AFB403
MPHVEPLREGDPAVVGPYRLVGRLGAGSQGVVYLGQARNGVPVAVKVLREGRTGDDRLAEQIAAARRVEPLGVAQVLDAAFAGRPYIVSEYVDGPPLQRAGRHTGAELQRLANATATALAAIHQAGVVHRDFKPANVLLGPGGPRVVDFGLAGDDHTPSAGGVVGTPAYMAPEQLAGQSAGAAADVFSWAGTVVFAATGRPPFGDGALPEVINRILHEEPELGDLPQPLRAIVQGCLAKDPGLRPAMRQVVLQLLGGEQPLPAAKAGRSPVRRGVRRALIAGVSGVMVLALSGAIVWLTSDPRRDAGPVVTTVTPASASSSSPKPTKTRVRHPRATGTPSPGSSTTPSPSASSSTRDAGTIRVLYVRAQGVRTAQTRDCQVGDTVISGLVEGTRWPVRFRYAWIVDGQVARRGTAYITEARTRAVVPPPALTIPGRHTVTLRVTSPVTARESIAVEVCPVGTE